MGRKRTIDTDSLYFDSKMVNLLKERGILFYQRLWALADDWGGYDPDLEDIALQMGAFKFSAKEVNSYLKLLIEAKKIIPYRVAGKIYHWIKNFPKHQPLTNPTLPTIPLPEWVKLKTLAYPSGKKYAKYEYFYKDGMEIPGSFPGNSVELHRTPQNSAELHRTPLLETETETETETDRSPSLDSEEATSPPKLKFLEFVFMTEDQHQKLINKFGEDGTRDRIQDLNNGIGSKGYKYKSHYHTILSWERKKEKENTPGAPEEDPMEIEWRKKYGKPMA